MLRNPLVRPRWLVDCLLNHVNVNAETFIHFTQRFSIKKNRFFYWLPRRTDKLEVRGSSIGGGKPFSRQKQFIAPISRKDSHKTGHSDRHWISIGYYSGYQRIPSVRPVDIQRMIAATWDGGKLPKGTR